MSSTFTRVAKVLVTNTTAVNTGTSPQTAVAGDVFLFDRQFNIASDTATVQTDANVDVVYVGLGLAGGGLETSMPIKVSNIRSVIRSAQTAGTLFAVTLSNYVVADNTEYAVKILYRDQFSTAPGHSMPRTYLITSGTGATAATIATVMAAKINADKNASVTAAQSGSTLVITAKAIPYAYTDQPQRVTFDVATPYGFASATVTPTQTVTGGARGQGQGPDVKEMEQNTKNVQRRLFPIPVDTTIAQVGTNYNLVTIEHYHEHIGDALNQRKEPLKTVVAFAAPSGTASAKETAFMTKLTSIVESAGVFVA